MLKLLLLDYPGSAKEVVCCEDSIEETDEGLLIPVGREWVLYKGKVKILSRFYVT